MIKKGLFLSTKKKSQKRFEQSPNCKPDKGAYSPDRPLLVSRGPVSRGQFSSFGLNTDGPHPFCATFRMSSTAPCAPCATSQAQMDHSGHTRLQSGGTEHCTTATKKNADNKSDRKKQRNPRIAFPPLCDIPSGCCSFTGPWTVTRSSLRMLRRVAAFCRPLRPVLLLVSFPRSRSPVVGVLGLC